MTWVRLDEAMPEHPKIAALSDSAFALFVTSLCYANRNLTDGFIPYGVGHGQLRFCEGNPVPAIRELEAAGLWDEIDGGWQVHDFADYQPSRESVLADREAARQRMARRRSPDVRSEQTANDAGDVRANIPRGSPSAVAVAVAEPETVTEQDQLPSATKASRARRTYGASFDRFWQAYPSEGRRDKPKAAKAFDRAMRRAIEAAGGQGIGELGALSLIVEGAERYAADPNRDPSKTKYAEGWLNGDRWNDPPLVAESPNGRAAVPGARSHALARELGS